MFTSRAEYRILLRQDNADLRLTELGHKLGLASDERMEKVIDKRNDIKSLTEELSKIKVEPESVNEGLENFSTSAIRERIHAVNLLRRPQIGLNEFKEINSDLKTLFDKYSPEVQEQVEIAVKYESYIDREQKLAEKIGNLEAYKIMPDFEYDRVKALSSEGREKLKKIKPETIGQASRISGVSPADISILTIYLGK
jgi:tRNA uridine 5-carboxymethylaminomethyl modification enzyme